MPNTVVVGQYGMTPQQMETAGIIKPGTAVLVQSLVNQGKDLASAMPPSIFTGKQGATNLTSFISNPTTQAGAVQTNLAKGQTDLINAGVITGKESSTQIAGLVKSAGTVGVSPTIDAVKNVAGGVAGIAAGVATGALGAAAGAVAGIAGAAAGAAAGIAGAIGGAASKALSAIGSGNLAGKLADEVTGGLSSLKKSLAGLASSKGVADVQASVGGVAKGAFDAIKKSFPKMPAGVPVNVAEITKKAAQEAEAASSSVSGALTNSLGSLKSAASGLLGPIQNAGSQLQNTLSGGLSAAGKSIPGAVSGAGGAAADFQQAAGKVLGTASPTLAGTISSVAGRAASIIPDAKGGAVLGALSGVTSAINTKGSTLTNALSSGLSGAAAGAVSGAINNALDKATGGVSTKLLTVSAALNPITGTTPTGVAGAFGAVTNLATGVAGAAVGAVTGSIGALSSGLSNLPGGAGAVGALVNKSLNSALGAATGALGKLTGALGGAVAGAAGLAGTIANTATGLLNNLKVPALNAASALAKSGLPAGAAAQLEAQISSIGSGGSVPIKMPVIAINTTNRGQIESQIGSLLADPGIPKPNLLGEVSASTVSSYESAQNALLEKINATNAAGAEMLKAKEKSDKAFAAWKKAQNDLPAGDPQIEALRQTALTLNAEATAKSDAFQKAKTEAGLGRTLTGSSVTGIGSGS